MSDDHIQSTGKYFRVTVPDFGTETLIGESSSRSMTSYLRLGAVPTSTPPQTEPGTDLAVLVQNFVDDTRQRDPAAYPVAQRQAESAKLHTRGGWRDHSDGNRVTTTRGDKVEVIRGNYKMVVLGRYDVVEGQDPTTVDGAINGTTSYESGGGHVQDWRVTPGAVTEISWVQDRGTWKVTEKTEKGDVYSVYNGEVIEEFYGPKVESIIGSENPGTLVPETNPNTANDFPVTRENPKIIEKTWATRIESYTGSSARPIPHIKEITHANHIEEETHATTIEETTNATTFKETTRANIISNSIGTSTETWIGQFFELFIGAAESFKLGAFIDLRTGLKILELNAAIVGVTGFKIAPLVFDLTLGKDINDIQLGLKWDVHIGNKFDAQIGPKTEYITAAANTVIVGPDNWVSAVMKRTALAIFLG